MRTPNFLKNIRPAMLFTGLVLAASVRAAVPDIVGEVTMVIGTASLRQGEAGEEALRRGSPVHAGDRIETAAGGHVHIRFIDGGLISVRPASRLHIQEYRKDSASARGAIRFQLEQGVVRSVTGEWGELARDRFRLNTPVAAIGIKGTDFIVKSVGDLTQASVVSGAIVMSPLEGACVGTLGPCNQDRSALLSAEMRGNMLELRQSGGAAPRFVPVVDLEARLDRPVVAQSGERASVPSPVGATEKPGATEKLALNQNIPGQLVDAALAGQVAKVPPSSPVVVPELPADRSLIWMRNAFEWNVPPNSISQRFDQAEAASRQAVVGNFFITLYRDEATRSGFAPPTGAVSFNLLDASASYSRQGVVYEPVAVSAAKLNVDFGRSTYDTSLALSGSFGQTQFGASGKIAANGTFVDAAATQSLAGAFSLDAKQAGYQFEKDVAYGKVNGITLWGR